MKAINKHAQKVFSAAINHLKGGLHARIDNSPGTYMPLVVERIGKLRYRSGKTLPVYSFAHYGEQNGDLMRDPDVTMAQDTSGDLYPLTFRNDYVGTNHDAIIYDDDGCVNAFQTRMQADIATFCGTWARNIKEQQAL